MKKIILFLLIACFTWTGAFAAIEMPSTQGSKFVFSFMRTDQGKTIKLTLTVSSPFAGTLKFYDPSSTLVGTYSINSGITVVPLTTGASNSNNGVGTGTYKNCYTNVYNSVQQQGYYVEAFYSGDNPATPEVEDANTPLKVSLYAGLDCSASSDAANVYPMEALGNEYYVVSRPANQIGYRGGGGTHNSRDTPSEFLIVAAEDGVSVDIYPTSLIKGQSPSDDIFPKITTPVLRRGETYLVTALSADSLLKGQNDLTGTRIVGASGSCKKFAVFSGSAYGSGINDPYNNGDYEYDQLFPTHLWGTDYITGSTRLYDGQGRDEIRVIASKPCTEVYINGVYVTTLNQGDFYSHRDVAGIGTYVHTSNPVEVGLFLSGQNVSSSADGGPALIVLAPMQQYLREIDFNVFTAQDVTGHSLMITALTSICEDTHLIQDGTYDQHLTSANGYNWVPISSNPIYSQLVISGLSTTSSYKLLNNASDDIKGGFTAIVYGSQGNNSGYGYSVGSAAVPLETLFYLSSDPSINSVTMDGNTCLTNRDVDFSVVFPYPYDRVTWDFGDGTPIVTKYYPEISAAHTYPNVGVNKQYTTTMIIYSNSTSCFASAGGSDTVKASYTVQYVPETITPTLVCKGSTLTCTKTATDFTDGATPNYFWAEAATPTVSVSTSNTFTLPSTLDYGMTKKYFVKTYNVNSCIAFVDTFDVTIKSIDNRHTQDNIICKGSDITSQDFDSYADFSSVPVDADYKWYKEGTAGSIHAGKTLPASKIALDFGESAKFWVEVQKGCMISDTTLVTVEAIKSSGASVALTVCKTNTLTPAALPSYTPYSSATPANNFTSGPTYAWYKNIPSGDISQIKLQTPVQAASSTTSYPLPTTDDFNTTASYYRLSEGGCAVVEKFDVTVDPIVSSTTVANANPILCKGSELKVPKIDAPITSYTSYRPTGSTGNFNSSVTYAWYKDIPNDDVSLIKSATPVQAASSTVSYQLPATDDFNSTAKYYRLTEGACAVVEKFNVTIEPIQRSAATPLAVTVCKGSELKVPVIGAPITSYTLYSSASPANNFAGTPTYAWYKNIPSGDISQIKLQTPVQAASSTVSYTLPTTDDFGATPKYYRLTENGCAVVEEIDVTVQPIQTGNVTAQTLCKGSSITSTRTTYVDPADGATKTFAAPVYTWYKGVTSIPNIKSETPVHNGASYSNLPDDYAANPQYYVLVENGCAVVDHYNVTIKDVVNNPNVVVDPACIGHVLSSTTTNASPDFASYNGTDPLAYRWNTSEITQDIQVQGTYQPAAQTINYSVEGTKGCKYIDHFTVTIPAEVKNNIAFSKSKVCGDGTTPVTVTFTQSGSVTDWKYNLNTDPDVMLVSTDNTHTITTTPTATGVAEDYTYTVTSESACQTILNGQAAITTKTVTANPPFTADLEATGTELSGSAPTYKLPTSGGIVTLLATTPSVNSTGFKYVWNDNSFANSATNQVNLTETASYIVTVTDQDGLCSSVSNKIDIVLSDIILNTIIIPASSSQYNRTFGKYDIEKTLVSDSYVGGYTLTIFNRYGTKIFEQSVSAGNNGDGWDGTYKGSIADAGVYFYILEYKVSTGGTKSRKGTIEVVKK